MSSHPSAELTSYLQGFARAGEPWPTLPLQCAAARARTLPIGIQTGAATSASQPSRELIADTMALAESIGQPNEHNQYDSTANTSTANRPSLNQAIRELDAISKSANLTKHKNIKARTYRDTDCAGTGQPTRSTKANNLISRSQTRKQAKSYNCHTHWHPLSTIQHYSQPECSPKDRTQNPRQDFTLGKIKDKSVGRRRRTIRA